MCLISFKNKNAIYEHNFLVMEFYRPVARFFYYIQAFSSVMVEKAGIPKDNCPSLTSELTDLPTTLRSIMSGILA